MANKRVVELNERTTIELADWLLVDDTTGTRKLSMARLLSYLSYSAIIFVDQLPTTDINPNMLYLVPHTGSVTEFDEYVYRDSQWNLLGVSVLDLTAVYQTLTDNDLETTSKSVVGAINELKSALSGKANTSQLVIKKTTAITPDSAGNFVLGDADGSIISVMVIDGYISKCGYNSSGFYQGTAVDVFGSPLTTEISITYFVKPN